MIFTYVLLILFFYIGQSYEIDFIVSGYNRNLTQYSISPDYNVKLDKSWKVDLNMSWIQIQPTMCTFCYQLFAIHEVSEYEGVRGGAISRWSPEQNGLIRKEWVSVGKGPAHLLVDYSHNLAFSANYADGSWDVVSLNDGALNQTVKREMYGPGCRNDTSHPHETVSLGDYVWVVDLGCDAIYHYKMSESGAGPDVTNIGVTKVGHGRGPRHMITIPERSLAIVTCELQNFVQLYHLNVKTSNLTLLQEINIVSVSGNAGAEILLHPNREWVYVSSRGVGMVVVFHLNKEKDQISKIQELRLHGTWPRSMSLSPNGELLVVADQMGDSVQLLNVSNHDGTLHNGNDNGVNVFDTPHQPSFVKFVM